MSNHKITGSNLIVKESDELHAEVTAELARAKAEVEEKDHIIADLLKTINKAKLTDEDS